jgi:threonine dehydrogenase-like Zn-dependent dehydrogenase
MYHKGLFFRTGRANVRTNIPAVVDCCRHHGFAPQRVPTTRYGFDDAPAAWMALDQLRVAVMRD